MRTSKKKAYAWIRRNALKLMLAAVSFALVSLVLGTSISTLLLAIAFILAASFSTFYYNYAVVPINFELVKIATIVFAYNHGAAGGLAVGIISTIAGKVLIGRIDEKLPLSVAAISLVAIGASLFSGADIVTLGIALVGIYNITMFALSIAMGGDLAWNLPYEGTNFLFNLILFTRLVPLL